MLSSYDQALYKILPHNLILYNLCLCGLDVASISFVYIILHTFLRYSIKPKHRFNKSLITHVIILITVFPTYYLIVPYRITHIQLIFFTIYITMLIQQHIFLQMIFGIILLMFNLHTYLGCVITSVMIFINWIIDEKHSRFYIRVILLIMVFTILISFLSLSFIILTYKMDK